MEPTISHVPPRSRTIRACDHCRKRKTKCDGSAQCSNCNGLRILCTFGGLVRTDPPPPTAQVSPTLIASAPHQVSRKSSLRPTPSELAILSSASSSSQSAVSHSPFESATSGGFPTFVSFRSSSSSKKSRTIDDPQRIDEVNLISTIHILDQNEGTSVSSSRYYSPLSGLGDLRCIALLCNRFIPADAQQCSIHVEDLISCLDFHVPQYQTLGGHLRLHDGILPSKEEVVYWVKGAFDNAFHLWPFIDKDKISDDIERIFQRHTFGQIVSDSDNLALVYALIALGQRFDDSLVRPAPFSAANVFPKGLTFFSAAKEMVNPAFCQRSPVAIQVTLCLALYLQTCSASSESHVYTSNAALAAIRQGLHVNDASWNQVNISLGTRQHILRAIEALDTYAAVAIGLPLTVRLDDMTVEADQYVLAETEDYEAPVQHDKLLSILTDAMNIRRQLVRVQGSHCVPYDHIKSNSDRLMSVRSQNDDLSSEWGKEEWRQQCFLSLARTYVSMLLYAPFLHHITTAATSDNQGPFSAGLQGIDAAISAIELAETMERYGILHEAYPITTSAIVLSTVIIMAVSLSPKNGDVAARIEPWRDRATALLQGLASRNKAAAGCLEAIQPIQPMLDSKRSLAASLRGDTPSAGNDEMDRDD